MSELLLATLLSTVLAAGTPQGRQEFLSWYNGWGTHTVWGIGKVEGAYFGTSVQCGTFLVPVRAVYDTHREHKPPTATQSRDYVTSSNLRLLRALKATGNECSFGTHSSPNNSSKRTRVPRAA
jgi:hypothetical protein